MNVTARELADTVVAARQAAWDKWDPTVAIVSTEHLNPEDEAVVRRVVSQAGYAGHEYDEMIRKVTALVVGQVEALADNQPAVDAD